MRSPFFAVVATAVIAGTSLLATTNSVFACAGLIGSNGAVNLGRTTTLAAYANGDEHYVTSFEFAGGGGEFGTLIPLPGVPSKVERGGGWTLQRLRLETAPKVLEDALFRAASADSFDQAVVLQEVRIDALDITVLKGGGPAVAAWAEEHGFRLSPDAPEVLDFYAERSPIFLAAVFDGAAAAERGQDVGDGTPVHLTIPTDNPWVPLRILGLGKQADDRVEADVYLLTESEPELLPGLRKGLNLTHSDKATKLLLDDLRSDDGMAWVPRSSWLTKLEIDSSVEDLNYDLAIDSDGKQPPSRIEAGLARVRPTGAGTLPTLDSAVADGGDDGNLAESLIGLGAIAVVILIAGVAVARTRSNAGAR